MYMWLRIHLYTLRLFFGFMTSFPQEFLWNIVFSGHFSTSFGSSKINSPQQPRNLNLDIETFQHFRSRFFSAHRTVVPKGSIDPRGGDGFGRRMHCESWRWWESYGRWTKNRGKNPKMDGENNGSNPIKMDDLGGFPPIFGNTHMESWVEDGVFYTIFILGDCWPWANKCHGFFCRRLNISVLSGLKFPVQKPFEGCFLLFQKVEWNPDNLVVRISLHSMLMLEIHVVSYLAKSGSLRRSLIVHQL